MRVKLESLTKPKCQIYPYGTEVPGWNGEGPSNPSRIKAVPREVKLALYKAKAENATEATAAPGSVRKPSSRLPDPSASKVTTRSAKTTNTPGPRGPSSDGPDGRTPTGRKPWTDEDDEKMFQLRRELPGRALAEVGARMERTASSVHARWAKHQKDGTLPEDLISPLPGWVPPQPAAPAFLTPPTNLVPLPPTTTRPNPTPLPSLPPSSGSPGYGWSSAETDLLIAMCNRTPAPSWDQIAAQLPGRTADACARRHRRISNKEIVPAPGTPGMIGGLDATAATPTFMSPPQSSPTLSRAANTPRMPMAGGRGAAAGASGERDRKRKRSGSTPGGVVAKSEWTKAENELLLSMVECDEPKTWAEVKETLPGRSEGACRGRYGRILKEREAEAASKAGVVEVAPPATPPTAKASSSSSEAARSSSAAPPNDAFWRAAASELGASRTADHSPATLSSMVRLPPLPPSTGLGLVSGSQGQPIVAPSSMPALPPSVMGKGRVSFGSPAAGFSGKENDGRGVGGAKRARVGGQNEVEGRREGEQGAAAALLRINEW